MRAVFSFAIWFTVAATLPVAQTRDPLQSAASGTARLSGRVVASDDNGRPIRGAIVTLSAQELPSDRGTITDDEGRFAFENLPAGRFTIKAAKPAYLATTYGARRPGGAGTAVAVAVGQQIETVTLRLLRGAVITGAIRDANGQAIPNVQVSAIRADVPADPRLVAPGGDAYVTDDRGVYRIFGLGPGDYLVAATPRTTGLGDVVIRTPGEIDAALARAQRGRGAIPAGRAQAAAPVNTSSTQAQTQAVYGFPPVFHPGTPSVSDAQRVTLATGVERSGVDITLEPARAAVIEGVIARADGGPIPTLTLSLGALGPTLPLGFGASPTLAVRPGADGRFKYTGVLPGKYVLTARAASATTLELARAQALAGQGLATPETPARVAAQPSLYAMADIIVVDDVRGLTLTLQRMLTLKGRVVFEGQSIAPPGNLTSLRITLGPPTAAAPSSAPQIITSDGRVLATSGLTVSAPVNADGSFEIQNVMPETYRLTLPLPASTPGQGWWLRSAVVDGRDLLDTLLDIKTSVSGVVLTFSDRHTELAGVFETAAGQPVNDSFMIAFSADPSMWHPQSRRVQTTRPASDGAFRFSDLPPGEYFLAALTDIDQDEWRDPAFLAQVAAAGAIRITLAEGERKAQNLRMGR